MSDHTDDPAELEELEASGLFDAAWYLLRNDDVRRRRSWTRCCISIATAGGRVASRTAYFDPAWYLQTYTLTCGKPG